MAQVKERRGGFIFWLSIHFSRGQNRSFFAPKPNGNACYAGYRGIDSLEILRCSYTCADIFTGCTYARLRSARWRCAGCDTTRIIEGMYVAINIKKILLYVGINKLRNTFKLARNRRGVWRVYARCPVQIPIDHSWNRWNKLENGEKGQTPCTGASA